MELPQIDVGDALRSEPNTAILTTPHLGIDGPVGATTASGMRGIACGDPNGCPTTAFSAGQLACFAVRTCTITSSACSFMNLAVATAGSGAAPTALVTRVRLQVHTDHALDRAAHTNGSYYLTEETYGLRAVLAFGPMMGRSNVGDVSQVILATIDQRRPATSAPRNASDIRSGPAKMPQRRGEATGLRGSHRRRA